MTSLDVSLKEIVRDSLSKKRDRLLDMIEPRFELTSQLVKFKVISAREMSQMRAVRPAHVCNSVLVELLINKSDSQCCSFLHALNESKQKHVTNFITDNTDGTDDRPLTSRELDVIYDNLPYLEEELDAENGLIDDMVASGCLTRAQMLYINESRPSEKNKTLLDILTRRSFADLIKFVSCLHNRNQRHIAELFEQGGVVVAVNCWLHKWTAEQTVRAESDVVRLALKLLQRSNKEQAREIKELAELREKGIRLIHAKLSCVKLYFLCRCQRSAVDLRQMIDSGKLRGIIENWFSNLLELQQQIHLLIDRVVMRSLVYHRLAGVDYRVFDRNNPGTQFHSLPYELHEMLLMRSTCLMIRRRLKTDVCPHKRVFKTCSTVCQYFHQLMTARPWFSNKLKRLLTALCHPHKLNTRLLVRLSTEGSLVRCLTRLNNRLYVACRQIDTLLVFDARPPFSRLPNITVHGLRVPRDMASNRGYNCVYLSDEASMSVWRIDGDDKVDRFLKVGRMAGMSVNKDGLLVMVMVIEARMTESKELYRGQLNLYTPSAEHVSTVQLSADIINPCHAVQTSRGTFIVCHGTMWTSRKCICEVDVTGAVLMSYDGGSLGQQLAWPTHLSVSSSGQVLVADYRGDRVVLLGTDLTMRRLLLTWSYHSNGVGFPWCLHYSRQQRHLVVGLYSGQVEIYSV